MGIFRQVGDGLRLSRYVPLGTILRNRKRQRRAKQLVRHYCRFLCLDALRRTGLAGELVRGDVRVPEEDGRPGYDPGVVFALAEYLSALRLIEVEDKGRWRTLRLTRRGRDFLAAPAGFLELISGYRPVLERLPDLLTGDPEARAAARRDERLIREASTSLGFDLAYPLVSRLIKKHGVSSVLELGSSRLALLRYLCDRNGVSAWGLDSDPRVVAESLSSLRGTSYEERIRVLEGDALAPGSVNLPPTSVDAILAVDLFHFYLKDEKGVTSALAGWRKKLASSLFIIVEVCRRPGRETANSPLPKLEYDLCHRLTGQALPTAEDWVGIFAAAGYRPAEKRIFPSLEHGAFVFRSGDRPA